VGCTGYCAGAMDPRMSSSPLVSVVTSVLNGERYLGEAVEGILVQSFRDFEFIIIDDGPTDGTASILERYEKCDPRVRPFHQENLGMAGSLNRGCQLAWGQSRSGKLLQAPSNRK